jgi:prepilin-type processing-associated H-X9-DG protein
MKKPWGYRLAQPSRGGLSRIDLLVAAMSVCLLASLTFSAFPSVREVARNHQCRANLSRLGMALHSYHDVHGSLPPAAFWVAGNTNLYRFLRERPVEVTHQNWFQLLLSLAGETNTADLFQVNANVTDPLNGNGRMARPSIATCPSDAYNRQDNPYVLVRSDGSEAKFARGNYAINGGTHWFSDAPGWLSCPRPNGLQFVYDLRTREYQLFGNGVAGFNKCFSFKDFDNGLSTLVGVEEVRAGIASIDPRGVWALGQIAGSVTWAHGANGDDGGPNCSNPSADDVLRGDELVRHFGVDRLVEMGMATCNHCIQNLQATSRSMHPGCVNVLFLDGSVRRVADAIDLGLWHVLHSRDTPASVLESLPDAALDGGDELGGSHAPLTDQKQDLATILGGGTGRLSFQVENSIGMQYCFVKPGSFVMGIPNKDYRGPVPYDAPEHPVQISRGFYMGKCEVTQRQFRTVMGFNPSFHSNDSEVAKHLHLNLPKDTTELPVENVTWFEAEQFCRKLSHLSAERLAGRTYRLPTEAEWEYSCRAGKSGAQSFDPNRDGSDKSGINAGKEWIDPQEIPQVVGSFPANPFGLHDMCGNVHEWCGDWFGKNYYAHSPTVDPQGPTGGYLKVIRGWHWIFTGPLCVTNITAEPWRKSPYVGFRVVETRVNLGKEQ